MSSPEERWSVTCIVPTFDRNGAHGVCNQYAEDASLTKAIDIMVRHLIEERETTLTKDYGKHSFPDQWGETSPMLRIRHMDWRDVP